MPRLCSTPGCYAPVTSGRCAACRRSAWHAASPVPRIRGERLQRLRFDLWVRDPHCQRCGQLILPSEAIRDHVINLRAGGSDTEDNVQLLCLACHGAKTHAESQRGRAATK